MCAYTVPRREPSLKTQELKARVVELKRQRLSYRDIAAEVGLSQSYVHQLYWEAMREVPAQVVEQYRAEELQLIDDAMVGLLKIATTDDSSRTRVEAYGKLLGWSQHRALIMGLNAPTRSVQRVITEEAFDAGIRELTARAASLPPAPPESAFDASADA